MEVDSTLTVLITGAAGRIGYALIPFMLDGSVFGKKKIILKLFDIPDMSEKLEGIEMEIHDAGFEYLHSVVATVDPVEAFGGAQVAALVGGLPRLPGMQRKDLIVANAESIKSQAVYLNQYSSKDVKVVVVANPANTNCMVAIKSAPSIPAKNFTCLTRLDEQRLRSLCAEKASISLGSKVFPSQIRNVSILGNHSTTQVAYIDGAHITAGGNTTPVNTLFNTAEYASLLETVQHRGATVMNKMKASSALSAAVAVSHHLRDWVGESSISESFSMGVLSDGNPYGIPDGLVYSFPCRRVAEGGYEIVSGLSFTPEMRQLMDLSVKELTEERSQAMEVLGSA